MWRPPPNKSYNRWLKSFRARNAGTFVKRSLNISAITCSPPLMTDIFGYFTGYWYSTGWMLAIGHPCHTLSTIVATNRLQSLLQTQEQRWTQQPIFLFCFDFDFFYKKILKSMKKGVTWCDTCVASNSAIFWSILGPFGKPFFCSIRIATSVWIVSGRGL